MKQYIFLVLLVGVLVILIGCTKKEASSTTTPSLSVSKEADLDWSKASLDAQTYQITFEGVSEAVKAGAKFYDVRGETEFQAGNFGITENLPLADLVAGRLPDLDKDTPIYVHCQSGRRSAEATAYLKQAGFTQVYDLGGLDHVQAIGGVLEK